MSHFELFVHPKGDTSRVIEEKIFDEASEVQTYAIKCLATHEPSAIEFTCRLVTYTEIPVGKDGTVDDSVGWEGYTRRIRKARR